jgi:hypothetical protein
MLTVKFMCKSSAEDEKTFLQFESCLLPRRCTEVLIARTCGSDLGSPQTWSGSEEALGVRPKQMSAVLKRGRCGHRHRGGYAVTGAGESYVYSQGTAGRGLGQDRKDREDSAPPPRFSDFLLPELRDNKSLWLKSLILDCTFF